MASFFVTLFKFLLSFGRGLRDPEFRTLFVSLLALLVSGTIFYTTVEHWGIIDAVYFCIMTLATVGYGDLYPTSPLSKLFTIIYLIVGAGIFVGFITKVTEHNRTRKNTGG